jgi:hypothetical protein
MGKQKAKMVLIYAHKDRGPLEDSGFIDFREGLARKADFWWDAKMSHPMWDEEIRRRLYSADVIVCLVSQAFLNSDYVTNVEAKIAYKRLVEEGILVVAAMLTSCWWRDRLWIRKIQHFPTDGKYLHGHRDRASVFTEIVKYIRNWLATEFRDPAWLWAQRRKTESQLGEDVKRWLRRDSCKHARLEVPDFKIQERIIEAAKQLIKKHGGTPLSKSQLEALDRQYLAGGSRKPDAEKVRWVLRSVGLHPQGRAVG